MVRSKYRVHERYWFCMRARQLMANSSEVKMTYQNAFDESRHALERPIRARVLVTEQVEEPHSGLIRQECVSHIRLIWKDG